MPQLDTSFFISQIFWFIVSFSLIYLFVSKFFIKKIVQIKKARSDKIKAMQNEVDQLSRKYKELDIKLKNSEADLDMALEKQKLQKAEEFEAQKSELSLEYQEKLNILQRDYQGKLNDFEKAQLQKLDQNAKDNIELIKRFLDSL